MNLPWRLVKCGCTPAKDSEYCPSAGWSDSPHKNLWQSQMNSNQEMSILPILNERASAFWLFRVSGVHYYKAATACTCRHTLRKLCRDQQKYRMDGILKINHSAADHLDLWSEVSFSIVAMVWRETEKHKEKKFQLLLHFLYSVPEKSTQMTPLLWKPLSTDTVLMELASQTWVSASLPTCRKSPRMYAL